MGVDPKVLVGKFTWMGHQYSKRHVRARFAMVPRKYLFPAKVVEYRNSCTKLACIFQTLRFLARLLGLRKIVASAQEAVLSKDAKEIA